ncbi:LuxR C-terminal-related transcriptional regulator [Streptomyces sioyaensis]|uniref:LuxR C-terminal-related transcriptional regulator n=1 Tax=Streptomyces sioyaensis TaxID=67364 RepID=UPI003795D910
MSHEATERDTLHRMYKYALAHGAGSGVALTELSAALVLPPSETKVAADQLVAMGLLRRQPGNCLVAVSPAEAAEVALSPLERDVRLQRLQIEEARKQLLSFVAEFESYLTSVDKPQSQFQVLEQLTDVRAVIADLTHHCREEILTAQPGGRRDEGVLEEAMPRDEDALKRGVRMQILYQHTARFSRGTTVYVDRVTQLGAHVRTLDDHFSRMLIFDRKAALIAVPGKAHAAALIREPHMVAFVTESYERLWLAAETFVGSTDTRVVIADDLRQSIVRLLTEGMTDASIANRLGMSVRTCRRHVAEIMAELGAQSRFQAGYMLAARAAVNT